MQCFTSTFAPEPAINSVFCLWQGFLTLSERFDLVMTKLGHIPEELIEDCIREPLCDNESRWLSHFVYENNITLKPALLAKLLSTVQTCTPRNCFPVCAICPIRANVNFSL